MLHIFIFSSFLHIFHPQLTVCYSSQSPDPPQYHIHIINQPDQQQNLPDAVIIINQEEVKVKSLPIGLWVDIFKKSESKKLTNRTLGRRELRTPPPPSVHYQPPLESGSSPEEFHL